METFTGHPKVDFVLSIVGALVPVFSALASFVNHLIRIKTSQGEAPNGVMLAAGAALNVVSVNLDKGVQLLKMANGKDVPQTGVAEEKTPSAPSVDTQ